MVRFADHIECSEAIAAHLVRNVPAPGADRDFFGIEDAHENVDFARCFVELAHLTGTQETGLFKRCTFALEPDGKYRTDYEY